jgi:hypothetical protein
MFHHVALVRTGVLEEHITSIIRVTKVGNLGTALAVTSNRSTLQKIDFFKRASVASYC